MSSALRAHKLDALVCSLPAHVLMLTGFWPIMANSVVVFTANADVVLLVPEDEDRLASEFCSADRVTFRPATMDALTTAEQAVAPPLLRALRRLGLERARIGMEMGSFAQPISYLSQYSYGCTLIEVLRRGLPDATATDADGLLRTETARKTGQELDHLRYACALAQSAFESASPKLQSGQRERETAALFENAYADVERRERPTRGDGFFFCMSGPNSAKAYVAYARSRHRALEQGDLVMLHANTAANGYWTDITRTYTCGDPDAQQTAMYAAILEARGAALAAIAPDVIACEVDKAARDVLRARGFGEDFKHATGHGVGFSAANHNAIPRIHPASQDRLEPGMTFNIEPAIYVEGYGGIRHCDVVALTEEGVEVLTDF